MDSLDIAIALREILEAQVKDGKSIHDVFSDTEDALDGAYQEYLDDNGLKRE